MKASELLPNVAMTFPLDAVNTDSVAVQLKSYRQKDAYFTVAVFPSFCDARDFVNLFPSIPHAKLRIVDCYGNNLFEHLIPFEASRYPVGCLNWWLDQSNELKECVTGLNFFVAIKKPELPKFSIRNVANKLVRSFIK